MAEGLFDPVQLECLEAMGLHVFALDGAEPVHIAPAPERTPVQTPVAPQALEQEALPTPAPAPAPAPVTRRPLAPQTPLERDVLAATGCRRRADSWAMVERLGVDFENLRGNPQAKRELWRQLRRERARLR